MKPGVLHQDAPGQSRLAFKEGENELGQGIGNISWDSTRPLS